MAKSDELPCCASCCITPGCPGCDTLRARVAELEAVLVRVTRLPETHTDAKDAIEDAIDWARAVLNPRIA